MTTLACTASQKSLTKIFIIQSMERRKIEQIQGRISRRKLVCNPTIQHVTINLYTKYDSSSLQGCGEIFDEKVLRNYGRTEGRTEWRTDVNQYTPPLFQSGGINKSAAGTALRPATELTLTRCHYCSTKWFGPQGRFWEKKFGEHFLFYVFLFPFFVFTYIFWN